MRPQGGLRSPAAGARVDWLRARLGQLPGAQGRSAAPAGVGSAARNDRRQGFAIPLVSIGLEADGAVPLEAEPAERCLKLLGEPGQSAIAIQVIDPQ